MPWMLKGAKPRGMSSSWNAQCGTCTWLKASRRRRFACFESSPQRSTSGRGFRQSKRLSRRRPVGTRFLRVVHLDHRVSGVDARVPPAMVASSVAQRKNAGLPGARRKSVALPLNTMPVGVPSVGDGRQCPSRLSAASSPTAPVRTGRDARKAGWSTSYLRPKL